MGRADSSLLVGVAAEEGVLQGTEPEAGGAAAAAKKKSLVKERQDEVLAVLFTKAERSHPISHKQNYWVHSSAL